MFGNIGLPEILVIGLIALAIYGPHRLPAAASDAARAIKKLRRMADDAMTDVRSEMGPEFTDLDLRSMHPKRWLEQQWNSADAEDSDDKNEADGDDAVAKAPKKAASTTRKPRAAASTRSQGRATTAARKPRSTATRSSSSTSKPKPAAKRATAR
jgi:sec-independent protein translocase protein TatB